MTKEEFLNLKTGDIVRGKLSGMAFVVTGNCKPHHVTAVRSVDITSPEDWDLICKEKGEGKEDTNRYPFIDRWPIAHSLPPKKRKNKL